MSEIVLRRTPRCIYSGRIFSFKYGIIKERLIGNETETVLMETGEKTAKITFYGGTGSVTGANFLLEIDGKKLLIDCGLTQGEKLADDINWDPFVYDPKTIDILFVTHGHVDHLGRIRSEEHTSELQ